MSALPGPPLTREEDRDADERDDGERNQLQGRDRDDPDEHSQRDRGAGTLDHQAVDTQGVAPGLLCWSPLGSTETPEDTTRRRRS